VVRASDDPSAASSAMALRSQQAGAEQYLRNIDDASGRLGVTYDALSDLSSQLRRARELLLQAGNVSVTDSGRAAIAQELGGTRDAVIGLYNTRWLDRPVFGGTSAGGIAVEVGTGSYVGNDADIVTRVSRDATVRTDVKGSAVGADTLPDLLTQLAADVVGGSGTATANLDTLAGEIDKVIGGLGDVGARGARVASARSILDAERLDLTARISEQEAGDIPETIMQLSAQQTAYQSALRAASQILQVSLVDFLR
jgi:flagellar hook-associated protein 3 FlgL